MQLLDAQPSCCWNRPGCALILAPSAPISAQGSPSQPPCLLAHAEGGWALTPEASRWARSAVWSRSFSIKRLAGGGGTEAPVPSPGGGSRGGVGAEALAPSPGKGGGGGGSVEAMVPLLDLTDHDTDHRVVWHTGETGEEPLQFVTLKGVAKVGRVGVWDFLASGGFRAFWGLWGFFKAQASWGRIGPAQQSECQSDDHQAVFGRHVLGMRSLAEAMSSPCMAMGMPCALCPVPHTLCPMPCAMCPVPCYNWQPCACALCPVPHAPSQSGVLCPMPCAPCPVPHAQLPVALELLYLLV